MVDGGSAMVQNLYCRASTLLTLNAYQVVLMQYAVKLYVGVIWVISCSFEESGTNRIHLLHSRPGGSMVEHSTPDS